MIGFNNKEYMPQSREASSIFLVCMEYCYLSLNVLEGELAYCRIPPSISVFLQFRFLNNLLVLISQRGIAGGPL